MAPCDVDDDRVRLRRIARPVHLRTLGLRSRLELHEVLVEPRQHVGLDAAPRLAQFLPVGQLCHDARALLADRVRRVAEVRPQLWIDELEPGGVGKAGHVAARIWARCRARTPVLVAAQPAADLEQTRAVDRRADLSAARDDGGALVVEHRRRRLGVLHRKGAAEAAALLGAGHVDELQAAHVAQQLERRVADARHAQRVAGGVIRDAVRERRTDVGDPQLADE